MSRDEAFARSELLFGAGGLERLARSSVAVVGVGGVGSYAAEALARAGIGRLVLVDHDRVEASNLNRQIVALRSTLGRLKVEVMRERILDINPACEVRVFPERFDAASAARILRLPLSYVVDAIDAVSAKIDLVLRCREFGLPVISSMGAGNKLDPSLLRVADLYETTTCPLARVMRRELRARGVDALTVVYSLESPARAEEEDEAAPKRGPSAVAPRRSVPGSSPFVPAAAGLLIASALVRGLLDGGEAMGERAQRGSPS